MKIILVLILVFKLNICSSQCIENDSYYYYEFLEKKNIVSFLERKYEVFKFNTKFELNNTNTRQLSDNSLLDTFYFSHNKINLEITSFYNAENEEQKICFYLNGKKIFYRKNDLLVRKSTLDRETLSESLKYFNDGKNKFILFLITTNGSLNNCINHVVIDVDGGRIFEYLGETMNDFYLLKRENKLYFPSYKYKSIILQDGFIGYHTLTLLPYNKCKKESGVPPQEPDDQ